MLEIFPKIIQGHIKFARYDRGAQFLGYKNMLLDIVNNGNDPVIGIFL